MCAVSFVQAARRIRNDFGVGKRYLYVCIMNVFAAGHHLKTHAKIIVAAN